ncbi:MAG: 3-oxoacyl-[acyl-carrier-protein] reductase [Candidatus Hydrogenedens sp.]|nr:3-oxoacyl-[acyl-carrier-protein] reductase [Candidatus Hydrogenedens sp.]
MAVLAGKTALITGGTRGIGRAIAERFAKEGAAVALCGRDAETAQRVAAEIGPNAHGFACDVSDPASVDGLLAAVTEQLGGVYALVNNAGITKDGLMMRMKDGDWDAVLQTNLTGAFYVCRAASRAMLKAREGRVINLTSIVGVHGQGGQTNYSAAKAGIIGFTKAYAQEVASRGITVNAIAPGLIDTDMTAVLTDDQRGAVLERIPLKRTGTVEDVAGAALFLASPDAAYVTGQVLCVDGGLGM